MTLEEIVNAFDARKNGVGFLARCPVHDDSTPSLRINAGTNGNVLVKCGAGCDTAQVLRAVGLQMRDLFSRPASVNAPAPRPMSASGAREARTYSTEELQARKDTACVYVYEDPDGGPLFLVLRTTAKDFRQYRAVDGRWQSGLGATPRVLYHLPRALSAAKAGRLVLVVEGEKDVENLEALGFVATTAPGGASAPWLESFTGALRGAHVVILPDNDEPGRKHGREVAAALQGFAASVRVLELPGVPQKGDASDWIGAGGTSDALRALIDSAPVAAGAPDAQPEEPEPKEPRKSQATQLFELAIASGSEFFHTPDGEPFVTASYEGRTDTWRLASGRARDWLRWLAHKSDLGSVGGKAVEDALGRLKSVATFEGAVSTVHLRIAAQPEAIYLDLANEHGEAVAITATGWSIVSTPPPRFVRPKNMLPLPRPVPGTPLSALRPFLNVTEEDWPLVAAWLLAAARPTGPYPVLSLHGEQGSAKSTACRALKFLLDPAKGGLTRPRRDEHELMIAARNSWLLAFDNLSSIDPEMSDALCSLATGGGFATRKLYTEDEEEVFEASRPLLLNGIAESKRSDLLDRCLVVELPPIAPELRRQESEFWKAFHAAHAGLLGGLCDALVVAASAPA